MVNENKKESSRYLTHSTRRFSKSHKRRQRRRADVTTTKSAQVDASPVVNSDHESSQYVCNKNILPETHLPDEGKCRTDGRRMSNGINITNDSILRDGKFIVRGSYHQGDHVFSTCSRGKQCTAMAVAAIAAVNLMPPLTWTRDTVDRVLLAGDNIFKSAIITRRPVDISERNAEYLTPQELPEDIDVLSAECKITLEDEVFGHLWRETEQGFPNLKTAVVSFFSRFHNENESYFPAAILTCNAVSVAIFSFDGLVWIFDSHSRDDLGNYTHDGKACLVGFINLETLLQMLMVNLPRSHEDDAFGNQYMITPVKIDTVPFIGKCFQSAIPEDMPFTEKVINGGECIINSSATTDSNNNVSISKMNSFVSTQSVPPLCEREVTTEGESFNDEECATEEIKTICDEKTSVKAHDLVRTSVRSEEFRNALISGRGIYNFGYVWKQLHEKFDNHSTMYDCSFENLTLLSSRSIGLKSVFRFKCAMCNFEENVLSEPQDKDTLDINSAMTLGAVVNGIGYFQAESLLAAMDIPCMAESTYQRYHNFILKNLMETAFREMKIAGEEERKIAIARGDIIDGIPHIRVIADGSWMKRSYQGGKFDSPSGAGAIIGEQTGKVLFIGLRNKFCSICNFISNRTVEPRPHTCYKNWGSTQSSASMEAHAIVEGFSMSVEQHGLIYSTLIADGDSSVFNKICEISPYREYNVQVKKIECRNHMFRSTRRNLKKLVNTGKLGKLKKVVKSNVENIMRCTHKAIQHRLEEATSWAEKKINLQKDISNIPSHVFGDHIKCLGASYCTSRNAIEAGSYIAALKKIGKFDDIEDCIRRLADNAESLLYSVNNNVVESFHNIIAKFIGGKRINWGKRGSYNARVAGAVAHCNTQEVMTAFSKTAGKKPSEVTVALEERRAHLNVLRQERMKSKNDKPKKKAPKTVGPNKDYGPEVEKPDLDEATYTAEHDRVIDKLKELQRTREELERDTLLQSDSPLWQSARRKLLTASNFGAVCQMKDSTSCAGIVQRIVYPRDLSHIPSIQHGKRNEEHARKILERHLNCVIQPCGLFVDPDIIGLGATPDGLIGNNSIVEIKCPYASRHCSIAEGVAQKKGNIQRIFVQNDMSRMNPEHQYYYQIQGQLHVTRRQYCVFMLWTLVDAVVIFVQRDDIFWKTKMEGRLTTFYEKCILPEIVDPRYTRSMPIRNPLYVPEKMPTKETSNSIGIKKMKII